MIVIKLLSTVKLFVETAGLYTIKNVMMGAIPVMMGVQLIARNKQDIHASGNLVSACCTNLKLG